jgi:hypothetical protein
MAEREASLGVAPCGEPHGDFAGNINSFRKVVRQ